MSTTAKTTAAKTTAQGAVHRGPSRQALLAMRPSELRQALSAGHPVNLSELDDMEYRGIALGLPAWLETLTWKTFRKVFCRDPATGHLRGWNVRVQQDGLDGAWQPIEVKGGPKTFGHYRVVPTHGRKVPPGCAQGVLIDYGLGGNGVLDPMRALRDPLVALDEGSAERLLGWSYVDCFGWQLGTPSYFLLERDCPLTHLRSPS